GLGAGAPAIGIPFFWPSSAMPNTVMDEWADMVFLKFNGATFSATTYPKLAKVIPSLTLTDARGEFPRIWDDGRGIDTGRALLSAQAAYAGYFNWAASIFATTSTTGPIMITDSIAINGVSNENSATGGQVATINPGDNRPRNIAFNFLVRAK
ncbi:tail fiber protein, partial [Citrobacter sedlakii]|nr:tail fiber protein [Citrobacter sedlakii]